MGIDRLTTLAFSLYSNKGAYAVLLGSGVSRSAHMPSAWDVENSLIEQLAAIQGVSGQDDWHKWFLGFYGTDADYSSLLANIASTKTERVALMKGFFEPDENEKELGWKKPTVAHRSLARLIKNGYVKVILTTNFDRLIEEALSSEGVSFQVVQDESDLDKIVPLQHSMVPTIVKINGDYIDCRFRNTAAELSSYPERFKSFISRIFEDYGLITCGWSATWDTGLVSILKNASHSRYNAFFGYVSKSNDTLNELAKCREGEILAMKDADSLFKELFEQVLALENSSVSHTTSKDILVARIKKYLSSSQYDIEYEDLVDQLGQEAYQKVQAVANYDQYLNQEVFQSFLKKHQEAVAELMDIAILVGRWGKPHHFKAIGEVLVKLCLRPLVPNQVTMGHTNYVHGIAPTLLLNTLGVASVHYGNFKGLNSVLSLKVPAENFMTYNKPEPLLYLIGDSHIGRDLNGLVDRNYFYPYSTLLIGLLQDHFQKVFTLNAEYESAFYKWEKLKSLVYGFNKCFILNIFHVPIGFFTRYEAEQRFRIQEESDYCVFFDSADELKNEWPPIKQGMFGGSYQKYKEVLDQAEDYYKNNRSIG